MKCPIRLVLTEMAEKIQFFPPFKSFYSEDREINWKMMGNRPFYFKHAGKNMRRISKIIRGPASCYELEERNIPVMKQVIYSGENDFLYRIRIIGVDNILQLFSTFHDSISEMGFAASDKRLEDVKGEAVGKKKSNSVFLRMGKHTSKIADFQLNANSKESGKHLKEQNSKNHFNHDGMFSHLQTMSRAFSLSFIPYMVKIECSLCLGSEVLATVMETKPVPFSLNPRFYEWIQFSNIRISYLPLETRLIFHLKVFSEDGQSLIIGATVLKLYNDRSRFRAGLQELNLWPFHKIENEFTCIGEYYGLVDKSQEENVSKMKEYARLYVQHDEFGLPMFYSLRDHEYMKNVGYPAINFNPTQSSTENTNIILSRNEISILEDIANRKINSSKKKAVLSPEERKVLIKLTKVHFKKGKEVEEEGKKEEIDDDKKVIEERIQYVLELIRSSKEHIIRHIEDRHFSELFGRDDQEKLMNRKELSQLKPLLFRDVLSLTYTQEEKEIIFKSRALFHEGMVNLMIFIKCLDYTNPDMINECHKMLSHWKPLDPEEAIPFLSHNYGDTAVRLYAMERVSLLPDDILDTYLYFLVEAIKFESYHQNPLTDFLMERAISSPQVGHHFYWLLKFHLSNSLVYERYFITLEEYLTHCGSFIFEIYVENYIAELVKEVGSGFFDSKFGEEKGKWDTKLENLKKKLDFICRDSSFPTSFCSPCDHRRIGVSFSSDSIQMKLDLKWLIFRMETESTFAGPIEIVFKNSIEMKRDVLLTEFLRVLDHIWQKNGIDFKITYKRVVLFDVFSGIFELPHESMSLLKVFDKGDRENAVLSYFKNRFPSRQMESTIDCFVKSTAGLFLFCYIFGVMEVKLSALYLTNFGGLALLDYGTISQSFSNKKSILPFGKNDKQHKWA